MAKNKIPTPPAVEEPKEEVKSSGGCTSAEIKKKNCC